MTRPRWWRMALVWFVVVAGVAVASPLWRKLDWWLFAHAAQMTAPPLLDALVLVDLPYDDQVGRFREHLIDLLVLLNRPENLPRAVVLDIEIGAEETRRADLAAAMAPFRATSSKCGIYAAVVPLHVGGQPDPGYASRLPRDIYEQALCGHGHTIFDEAAGVAKYDPQFALDARQRVPALAVRVAEDHFNRPHDADARPIVVRMGDPAAVQARTVRFDPAQRLLVTPADRFTLRDRIVVVGSPQADRRPGARASGPEYLLWALSARGQPPERAEARLIASPWILTALIIACAALAAGTARWVYRAIPRSHSHLWLIAVTAAVVPLVVLWGMATALAAANVLVPQLSLPAIGAVVAACLAWHVARRYLQWASLHPEAPQPQAEYDVFVSYSRTDPRHVAWVKTAIVGPLRQALRSDGKNYRVFFDTDTIAPGEAWILRMFHAIDASRFFLPVYSPDYFEKDFCKREIAHAFKYQRTDHVYMIPVDTVGKPAPSPYDNVQAIRVANDPGFLQSVLAEMERGLRADRVRAQSAAAPAAAATPLKAG
jgi:hypothetical protein